MLNILRKKDETIQQLEDKLEQEFELNQSLRMNDDEQVKKLQREIERLQNRVIEQSELMRKKDVDALELIQSSSGAHASHMQTESFVSNVKFAEDEIVHELKNKISSQNEQIEILVTEVQSLRKSDSSSSQNKNEQIGQLMADLESARDEVQAKSLANANLQRALAESQNVIRNHRQLINDRKDADVDDDDGVDLPPPPSAKINSNYNNTNDDDTDYERTVFEQTSKICDLEIQCSNHLAAISKKDSNIRQLQHKLRELENTSNTISQNSQTSQKELIETRKRLHQYEVRIHYSWLKVNFFASTKTNPPFSSTTIYNSSRMQFLTTTKQGTNSFW